MVIYKLVDIKTLERIQSIRIIQGMGYGLLVEDREKVCSTNDTINVDDRDISLDQNSQGLQPTSRCQGQVDDQMLKTSERGHTGGVPRQL